MKWSQHIKYICRNAKVCSYQILKTFKTKNIWTFRQLFLTYVRPKVEYNSAVWSPSLKTDIAKIESIQKSYTRTIFLRCGVPFTSYEDRLTKLNLLSLQNRRKLIDILLMYKIVYGLSDLKFDNFFEYKNIPYALRGNDLKVDVKNSYRCSQFESSFFFRITKLWNSLPVNLVRSSTFETFKSKLKYHILCSPS